MIKFVSLYINGTEHDSIFVDATVSQYLALGSTDDDMATKCWSASLILSMMDPLVSSYNNI